MATHEYKGRLTYVDGDGNRNVLYPVTDTAAVAGLDDAIAKEGDGILAEAKSYTDGNIANLQDQINEKEPLGLVITGTSEDSYVSTDYGSSDVYSAHSAGKRVFLALDECYVLPLTCCTESALVFSATVDGGKSYTVCVDVESEEWALLDGIEEGATSGGALVASSHTLSASDWALGSDERYYQTVSVDGVTTDESQVIVVDPALTGTDLEADAAVLEAWQEPSGHNVTQGDGTLTFYAYTAPTVNIPINVGV